MKTKLLIIFSLIIIIPTVTIICLGVNLTRSESNLVKEKFRELLTEKLYDVEKDLAKVLEERERLLLPITDIQSVDINTLRDLSSQNALINQIFILNPKRELVYPAMETNGLTNSEKNFHKRTSDIWESGEQFYRPDEVIPQAQRAQLQRNQQKLLLQTQQVDQQQNYLSGNAKNSYLTNLTSSTNVKPESGWYTWYRGQGLNFILWKRNESDLIIGLELNRARLIADIIATLPDSTNEKELIVLKNASNELYRWGLYKQDENELPKAQISLDVPLQSWQLCYFTSDAAFTGNYSKSILFNYAFGGIILVILLSGLCVYFFRENNRQLRESSQRVNFVNQVSHELKSPLTNIRPYSELLRKRLDPDDAKAENQLGVVVSESQRLSRLITNVLSFAQQDKNKLKLNMKKINIDKTVDHVLDHFKPLLATKEISFEVKNNSPLAISADEDAIGQILGNLLSNVEKYVQEKGHVSIDISQDPQWTTVTVSDNGPGIPKNQHKRIFDAFHRLSNKLSDGISGTGIGLSISQDLAKMHQGDLSIIDSTKGASFKLRLPTKGIQK